MTPARADDARITELIRTNGQDLLGYLIRRVDSPEAAADVLSDVFLVIWRRRDAVPRDAADARMWCFGVARNALRDHRRSRSRQAGLADALRAHLASGEHLASTAVPDAADPAAAAEDAEQASAVRAALSTLKREDRELIILVHWDGFTLADAAALIGLKASTARTRYARARAELAGILSPDPAPRSPVSPADSLSPPEEACTSSTGTRGFLPRHPRVQRPTA